MLEEFAANTRTASGHVGEVRAGYQLALSLTNWTLTPNARTGKHTVTGTVVSSSEHWLSYEPLSLSLELGHGKWIWNDVRPIIEGERVTIAVANRPILERSQ